ncbi:peptidyl-prolyl cis-trans isomerase D [Diutina catenulata]
MFFIAYLLLVVAAYTLTAEESKHLEGDPPITHVVKFDLSSKGRPLGSLDMALFGQTVPKTVGNFVWLCEQPTGYNNTVFHRVIENFMVQGGQTKGGTSKYGGRFDDENFILKHNKLGRMSCANAGANTNMDQFFITNVDSTAWLDGKHVVFGQLINGFDTLRKVSTAPKKDSVLDDEVSIVGVTVQSVTDSVGPITEEPMSTTVTEAKANAELYHPEKSHIAFGGLAFVLIAGLILYVVKRNRRMLTSRVAGDVNRKYS